MCVCVRVLHLYMHVFARFKGFCMCSFTIFSVSLCVSVYSACTHIGVNKNTEIRAAMHTHTHTHTRLYRYPLAIHANRMHVILAHKPDDIYCTSCTYIKTHVSIGYVRFDCSKISISFVYCSLCYLYCTMCSIKASLDGRYMYCTRSIILFEF